MSLMWLPYHSIPLLCCRAMLPFPTPYSLRCPFSQFFRIKGLWVLNFTVRLMVIVTTENGDSNIGGLLRRRKKNDPRLWTGPRCVKSSICPVSSGLFLWTRTYGNQRWWILITVIFRISSYSCVIIIVVDVTQLRIYAVIMGLWWARISCIQRLLFTRYSRCL